MSFSTSSCAPSRKDVLTHVFSFLSFEDSAAARSVCREWNTADRDSKIAQMHSIPFDSALGRRIALLQGRQEKPSEIFEQTIPPLCRALKNAHYMVPFGDWLKTNIDPSARFSSSGIEQIGRSWTLVSDQILIDFADFLNEQLPGFFDPAEISEQKIDAQQLRSWIKTAPARLAAVRSFQPFDAKGIPPEVVYLPNLDAKTIEGCLLKACDQGHLETVEAMLSNAPFFDSLKKAAGKALCQSVERHSPWCALAILKSNLCEAITPEDLGQALKTAAAAGFTAIVQEIVRLPRWQQKNQADLKKNLDDASSQAKWHDRWPSLMLLEQTKEQLGFPSTFWRERNGYRTDRYLR